MWRSAFGAGSVRNSAASSEDRDQLKDIARMKLNQFTNYLKQTPDRELRFVLPDGSMIEAHAHISEVGRVEKRFIDCGGTVRRQVHCSLQAWVADDTEHRLAPGALASIIEKAGPI